MNFFSRVGANTCFGFKFQSTYLRCPIEWTLPPSCKIPELWALAGRVLPPATLALCSPKYDVALRPSPRSPRRAGFPPELWVSANTAARLKPGVFWERRKGVSGSAHCPLESTEASGRLSSNIFGLLESSLCPVHNKFQVLTLNCIWVNSAFCTQRSRRSPDYVCSVAAASLLSAPASVWFLGVMATQSSLNSHMSQCCICFGEETSPPPMNSPLCSKVGSLLALTRTVELNKT